MKKRSVLWLSVVLILSLVVSACGSSSGNSSQPASSSNSGSSGGSADSGKQTAPAPADTKPSDKKIVIKLGHTIADSTSLHKGAVKFKELVEKNSNGQMEVQVFPASQLGNEKDMVEGNILNTFQISIPSAAMVSSFAPKAGVLGMPYVIKGSNERERFASLKKLAASDAFQEIAKEAEAAGLKIIPEAVWWYGDRNVTTNGKAIMKPEDLKGIKIRTPDAQVHTEPFKQIGANVTPMAFTEVYMALKTGTIDAQENPINTIYTSKFYEVQDTVNLTGHMTQNQIPTISLKFWNSLTPEQQKIISDAMIEAGDYQSEIQIKANEDQVAELEKNGMKVVKSDQAAFKEAMKDVYKAFEGKFGAGFYEKVVKAQE